MKVSDYLELPFERRVEQITDESGTYYHARMMELEGCQSTGSTREEALQNLQEAMAGWVETKLVNGYPIPAIFLKKTKK